MSCAWSVHHCRRGSVVVTNADATEVLVIPATCKSWACPNCAPKLRDLWAQRIANAKPNRFITLTCQPSRFLDPRDAYEKMKAALPEFVRIIRQKCGPFEYAAVWELHESGWPHLHIAQKGMYVPKALVATVWDSLGIGYCTDIRAITGNSGIARYVAKYMTKTLQDGKRQLAITKIIQHSRHFFEKTLLDDPKLNTANPNTAYFFASPADIIDLLMRRSDYRMDFLYEGAAYRLLKDTPTTPLDLLHALQMLDVPA